MKIFRKLALVLTIAAVFTGCGQDTAATEATTAVDTTAAVETTAGTEEATTQEETTQEETTQEETTAVVEAVQKIELADGEYLVDFKTDSTMFHVNEACDGKGVLTVQDGEASVHILLTSKNFLHLYRGLKEDAQKDGAVLLDPVFEEVTYSDGTKEEVAAFDVPVPYLDDEFDLALIGKKEVWYDHKVSVSDPELMAEENGERVELEEGEYRIPVALEGGTGKAKLDSPTKVVFSDGVYTVTLCWSSKNYDYMKVGEEKYLPINEEGNSVFEIPFSDLSQPIDVIADTVAMSEPHEIEYTLTFDLSGIE